MTYKQKLEKQAKSYCEKNGYRFVCVSDEPVEDIADMAFMYVDKNDEVFWLDWWTLDERLTNN